MPVVAIIFLAAHEARPHGFSDIEGSLLVGPVGALPGDTATLSMTLREKTRGALAGVTTKARIHAGKNSIDKPFESPGGGRYVIRVPLDSGFHEVRVILAKAENQEFAMNGFWVKPSLQEPLGKDARLEFVPEGKWESMPWLDNLSGILIVVAGLIALALLWRKKAGSTARQPGSVGVSPWVLGVAALGSLSMPLGAYWDIAYHFSRGRESFFSPPHLLIYGGIALVFLALQSGLRAEAGNQGWKSLFRRASPASAAALALAIQLASAPFDELWHYLFGLDVGIWSPPHAILIAGGFAACLSLACLPIRDSFYRASFFRVVLFAGAILIGNVFLAESEFPFPSWHVSNLRPDAVYPALMAFFSLIVLFTARTVIRFRFTFLAISMVYVAVRMAVYPLLSRMGVAVVPEFPNWLTIPLVIAFIKEILGTVVFRSHFQTAFGSRESHV